MGPRLFGEDGLLDEEDEESLGCGPSCLLDVELRAAVAKHLSPTLAMRDWTLRYSTEQHGCSLRTMYHLLDNTGPTVILVLDSQGARFGGFATARWSPGARYFGTGESFLFRVEGASAGRPAAAHFYPWSGANSHFQLAYHDSIAMGGGGHFGLWLDEAFEYGSSGSSETYGNPPLASDESFRVIRVEVWELTALESQLSPRGLGGGDLEFGDTPVIERAARQGSSAFLLNMLNPLAGSRRD